VDYLNRYAISVSSAAGKYRHSWRLVWTVFVLGLVALGAGADGDLGPP
jgi:hypothetical protein